MPAALGWQYAQRRKDKRLTQIDMDGQLGFMGRQTRYMEHGTIKGDGSLPPNRTVSFQRYLSYADFLGVSFVKLFTAALAQIAAGGEESGISDQQTQVHQILHYVKEDKKQECYLPVPVGDKDNISSGPQWGVEEGIGLPAERLRQEDPPTSEGQDASKLHEGAVRQRHMSEQEWLAKVRLAYEQLTARGERVTVKAICQSIPATLETLRRYSQIQPFLAEVVDEEMYQAQRRKAQLREEMLADRVQQAIDQLKIRGQLVTQAAIAELVQKPIGSLREYPSIRIVLNKVAVEERLDQAKLREEEYLKQIKEAISLLESRGQRVNAKAVGEMIHLCMNTLISRYPQIKDFWQQVRTERDCQQGVRKEKREESLLGQVQEKIARLELQAEPITASAISRLMGMSVGGLRRYKQVSQLLDSVVQANRV